MNVIIPIRDREKELDILTDKLVDIFKKQNIQYNIIIIEQCDGKKFNKGKISNVGFLEAERMNFSDNYLFNDVDVFPINDKIIDYKFHKKIKNSEIIRHPYGHKHCFSCFFLITGTIFKKINGYSNNFWGWGGEDTNLEHRARALEIKINRENFHNRNKEYFVDDNSGTMATINKTNKNQ